MKFRLVLSALLLSGISAVQAANIAEAVSQGQRDQAFLLLDNGNADVDSTLVDGSTALLYAAYQGDRALVEALLEAGANPDTKNRYGAFALSEAAQIGASDVVALLLKHGANPNLANPEGETALMVAARSGSLKSAELLLKAGADVNAREHWGGQTPVMWAAAQQQVDMLKLLIKHKADLNLHSTMRLWDRRTMNEPRPKDMNKGGFSAIQYAARQGCKACIPILAKAGADLNAVDPDRVSALNMALINQNFDTAKALIDAGADINQWDLWGRAPLYNALDLNEVPTGGRPDIPSYDELTGYDLAKLLLERGANPNMQLKGRPPYRNAIYDRGADNVLSTGATPLIRAARSADNASVRLLLENGAHVDLPNALGHTPLMIVSGMDWPADPTRGQYKTEEQSIETIDILLEYGADINALTGDPAQRPEVILAEADRNPGLQPAIRGAPMNDNQNALHAAAKVGWTKIAKHLIDKGIKQELQDTSGRTPFDWAMARYPPAFNQSTPEPLIEMAMLLQEECLKTDNCVMKDPVDFSKR